MAKIYNTKQTTSSFPKWYHDTFWTHMLMIHINDEFYKFIPPNQSDWHIILTYEGSCWCVYASRDTGESFKHIYKVL